MFLTICSPIIAREVNMISEIYMCESFLNEIWKGRGSRKIQ